MRYQINLVTVDTQPHQHKFYEIMVYQRGEGYLRTKEGLIPVGPGKIMIVPPGVEHGSIFPEGGERYPITGDFDHIFSFTAPTLVSDNAKKEGLMLARMIYQNRFANPEYVTALGSAFAHFLVQSMKLDDPVIQKIREIIQSMTDRFYDCNLDLCALLHESGYAEDYIRAKFRQHTGKTPTEYLTRLRISHACFLIDIYRHSVPLSDIAEKCGYTDYVYFSRRFKQLTGLSPRDYMEQ